VKSYIRTIYRKIDVTSRTQAVLWGVRHGFTPDHHRVEHWRGGPERQVRWRSRFRSMSEGPGGASAAIATIGTPGITQLISRPRVTSCTDSLRGEPRRLGRADAGRTAAERTQIDPK
jgi:hypothetical protein